MVLKAGSRSNRWGSHCQLALALSTLSHSGSFSEGGHSTARRGNWSSKGLNRASPACRGSQEYLGLRNSQNHHRHRLGPFQGMGLESRWYYLCLRHQGSFPRWWSRSLGLAPDILKILLLYLCQCPLRCQFLAGEEVSELKDLDLG